MLKAARDALACPFCRSLLRSPVSLHCGHSVCKLHLNSHRDCPLTGCTPPPAAAPPNLPPGSTVEFQAEEQEQVLVPPLHPAAHDVTLEKIINLVERTRQRQSLRQRPSDDDDDDTPPRKRHKPDTSRDPRDSDDNEPDLVAHLRTSAAIAKTVSADQPLITTPEPVLAAFERELTQELSCDICCNLFYKPVTTPCQHASLHIELRTFCTKCLHRSLDHSQKCPVCRTELPGFAYFQAHPLNSVVLRLLHLEAFRPVYQARGEAIEEEERAARLDTPIFICLLSLPGIPVGIRVFEPRYRLMLRRCLESPVPQFGMLPNISGTQNIYGTMLQIQSVKLLPNGESIVKAVGTKRFRVLESGVLDGYMVGRIEFIEDFPDDLIDSIDTMNLSKSDDEGSPSTSTPTPLPPDPSPSRQSEEETFRNMVAIEGSSSASSSRHRPPPVRQRPVRPSNEELVEICRTFIDRLSRAVPNTKSSAEAIAGCALDRTVEQQLVVLFRLYDLVSLVFLNCFLFPFLCVTMPFQWFSV
ncbi:hypothetical protein CC1G_14633 [Coprinopsis cinerea okayama7|uniref:RING-type domain-containing protein n=1 Tax=Coprinopsis cinerea (strain Okayama-7 / 130 / ATCC MYA-4618 / FGSC 9003) TaxID=240176 RepID=D6RMW1_COPC7|nr:hypothetical protein CC1G_14633 [Coprinopsis cinerea okayama7\|eukprot:XP_002911202.1 hypothetical protein CC1G_14633 [Coprinopsis cinerea okayama7\